MSIVELRQVSLVGPAAGKEQVLDGLQALGVMHLIPLRPPQPLAPRDPELLRRARTALRHLRQAPERMRPYRGDQAYDRAATIAQILANRRRLRELGDRRDDLLALIEELTPWGEFALPPPEALAGLRLWLYALPLKERRALDGLALPWVVVGKGPTQLHLVVMAHDEPPADALPVARVQGGEVPLSRLEAELEAVEIAIEEAQLERQALTRWRRHLQADLMAELDRDALREAAGQTHDEPALFAVQGWAPTAELPALERLARRHGLALLAEAVGAEDRPPTLLELPRGVAGAAELTRFYTSPGYRTWDPSLIVFGSFALFFAMIVADAGYAALLVLGCLLGWRALGRGEAGRRMRPILATLAGTALVYGILAGSYFGRHPPPGSFLDRLHLLDITDFAVMMRLSVLIGAVHLSLAHGAVAWLNRGRGALLLPPLGWLAAIWGGILMWLGGSAGETLGAGLLGLGLLAVFWGAGAGRPVRTPKDLGQRVMAGVLGLTGATRQFGDMLSYLRLFALGLASASLASTFNGLAGELRAALPGIGLLLGLLVLLLGHGVTFLLGVMSGVVHGLRLNFIEFFGWGLTEEGYPFKPFKKGETPT